MFIHLRSAWIPIFALSSLTACGQLTSAVSQGTSSSSLSSQTSLLDTKSATSLRKTADELIARTNSATATKLALKQKAQTVGGTSNTEFGINYWPQARTIGNVLYQQSEVLYDAAWPTFRPQVIKDLDSMSALGVSTLRLMFWPNYSGFGMSHFGGWDYNSSLKFQELQKNLKDLLALAQQHQMKVVISFANRYILDYVCSNGQSPYTSDCRQYPLQTWWQWGYGDAWLNHDNYWQSQAFVNFLTSSNQWMTGIINASESSAGSTQVIYYDYFNEFAGQPSAIGDVLISDYQNWYIRYVFQWVSAPAGKKGISFLHTDTSAPSLTYGLNDDVNSFNSLVGASAVQWVEFHPYADGYWDWSGQNLAAYQHDIAVNNWVLQQGFPSAHIVMGEFGMNDFNSPTEQNKWDMAALSAASSSGIGLAMHWGLWEDATGSTGGHGYASTPGAVHDVYGAIADTMAGFKNFDFESINSFNLPTSWSAAASQPAAFQFASVMGDSSQYGGPSTGSRYARMQLTPTSGAGVWMVHDPIATNGKINVSANFSFRTNFSTNGSFVQLVVLQYNSVGQMIAQSAGPTCLANDWLWHDYVQSCGAQQLTISSDATQVILAITGTTPSPSSGMQYLDIDTVSFSIR